MWWGKKDKEEKVNRIINDKCTWTVNDLGGEGARMISEGLKCNSTLTKLNLYSDEKKD